LLLVFKNSIFLTKTTKQQQQASSTTAPPSAAPEAAPYRQVKFENALDFLDEVKLVFANQPEV
jgi:histone deacetylase complex regulatory component SIN3